MGSFPEDTRLSARFRRVEHCTPARGGGRWIGYFNPPQAAPVIESGLEPAAAKP
ncbi:hypothetical protein [Variovorax sp. PBS-H4]|uniref:hypothetical protein n=1 Tax=Variovorax sp. PBS-H4 TaxID=434008 RepID=UPI0013A55046|nr:hypothetical protein [Variovorax sp. PBS-H4]